MIEAKDLFKNFGKYEVLKNISFKLNVGEICGFLGPNGAGKTTTMRILTSYFPPTSGFVHIAGFDILKEPHRARSKIGYLPENVPLYNDMTVNQYLTYMAKLKGIKGKNVKTKVEMVIGSCQLDDVQSKLISHLSKGFRQRVGLAQALVHEPEVLILDEPTIGLDPNQIKKTRELIKNNAWSKTVLLSTHILPEVNQICDYVIIIDKGKIIASDKPGNLGKKFENYEGLYLKIKAPKNDLENILKTIDEIKEFKISKVDENILEVELEAKLGSGLQEKISSIIVNKGWGLLEMRPVTADLEDVFHRLTMEESL